MRIALFRTCVADTMFPDAVTSTARLLKRLGHEVLVPRQACCGQMHLNSGYPDEAAPMARRFIAAFADCDYVVAPSASCVGAIRELYPRVLGISDPVLERTVEFSEFLVHRLGIEDVGASFPHRVVYHPTCHALRLTKVGDAPLRLLHRVRGLELIELERADECCGFGGTFSIKNPETSSAILADKCAAIEAADADFCTALDGSCLLQIGGGLSRRGARTQPIHLAQVLAAE